MRGKGRQDKEEGECETGEEKKKSIPRRERRDGGMTGKRNSFSSRTEQPRDV